MVVDLVHVHTLAEVGIRGVGSAEVDGLCIGQCAVATLTSAGTRDDADLEGAAGFVLGFCLLGNFCRSALRGACRSESAKTDGLAVLYECGSLGGCDFVDEIESLCIQRAKDLFGALIASGAMAHMMIQVILNIAVVTSTVPNTGISLPFFSYGGTSLMLQIFEVGIILSISRYCTHEKI